MGHCHPDFHKNVHHSFIIRAPKCKHADASQREMVKKVWYARRARSQNTSVAAHGTSEQVVGWRQEGTCPWFHLCDVQGQAKQVGGERQGRGSRHSPTPGAWKGPVSPSGAWLQVDGNTQRRAGQIGVLPFDRSAEVLGFLLLGCS